MSLPEVADMLVNDYGVYNALNLDGGGSTTMAMQNPSTGLGSIINVSSDNPNGRSVGSNLAVFALTVHEPSFAIPVAVAISLSILRRNWRNKKPASLPPA